MLIPLVVILTLVVVFIPSFFLYDDIEKADREAKKKRNK